MNSRYQVVPRTLIFVFNQGKVLLLQGASDKKHFAGLYNGLGGHVECGETVLECARREVREESGLDIHDLQLCGIINDSTAEDFGIQVHLFRCELAGAPPPLRASAEGKLDWYTHAELAQLPLVPDIEPYLNRIWDWQPGSPIFYATVNWQQPDMPLLRFTE